MKWLAGIIALVGVVSIAGCSSGGNIKTASDYDSPKPPPIRNPTFQAFAPYGQSSAIWHPPVANRDGTIVRPRDPAASWDRPDYEAAEWAKGAAPSAYEGPAGTF